MGFPAYIPIGTVVSSTLSWRGVSKPYTANLFEINCAGFDILSLFKTFFGEDMIGLLEKSFPLESMGWVQTISLQTWHAMSVH